MSTPEKTRAFITTTDTMCQGIVAAWRDDTGKPVLYDTFEEAREDAEDEELLAGGNDPDGILEVVVEPDRIYDPVDGRVYWRAGDKP